MSENKTNADTELKTSSA